MNIQQQKSWDSIKLMTVTCLIWLSRQDLSPLCAVKRDPQEIVTKPTYQPKKHDNQVNPPLMKHRFFIMQRETPWNRYPL